MALGMRADELVYGFSLGRVRVREGLLVDHVRIGRLAECESLEAMHSVLAETLYGPLLAGAETIEDVETAFSRRLGEAYGVSEAGGTPPQLSGYFRARHDYENLRAAVKSGFGRELKAPFSQLGRVPARQFSTYARTRTFADLPPVLEEAARAAVRAYERTGRPGAIDRELDRFYFDETLGLAASLRTSWVERVARIRVDIVNGSVISRAGALGQKVSEWREDLLRGGYISTPEWVRWAKQEPGTTELGAMMAELVLDRPPPMEYRRRALAYWARLLDEGKLIASGPAPIFAYISRIEQEVKTLRTVIVARLFGLADSRAILAQAEPG